MRLQDLKTQGIVRPAKGQNGFLLVSSANGVKKYKRKTSLSRPTSAQKTASKSTKSEPATKKRGGNGSCPAKVAKTAKDNAKRPG